MTQPPSPPSEPSIKTSVDRISPVLVEVSVEVPWSKVNSGLEDAYRLLQKQARVRGFRPGKVPRGVVKQLMGKSVQAEVKKSLIEEGLGEAVKAHELRAVAVPEVDNPSIEDGQPLTFKAKLEVQPEIGAVDLSQLQVERVSETVDEAQVDAEIERLREQEAELRAPDPPRPARDGDTVTLEIEVEVDGEARPDLASKETRSELGAGELLGPIEEAVRGLSVGASADAEHAFGDDVGDESLRGKSARFHITLKQLQEKLLPELDDEFAKDVDHESLEALRADVRARLEQTERRRAQSRVRETLVDKLIDDNPVEVPPSLLEQQEQAMLADFFRFQQLLGRQAPIDEETLTSFRERAKRKIQASLLLGEIARANNLEVSEEDIERKLGELAEESGKHVAKVRADYQGERRDDLRTQLLQNKLLEYLESQATITEVSAEELAQRAARQAESTESVAEAKDEAEQGAEPAEAETGAKKAPKKKAGSTKKRPGKKPESAAAAAGEATEQTSKESSKASGPTEKKKSSAKKKAKKPQEADT